MRKWRRRHGPTAADIDATAGSSQEITLVPSGGAGHPGLKARVEVHELDSARGSLVCCSYLSDGLSVLGQKEVVFTVRGEVGEELPDLRPVLEWFKVLYRFSEQGQFVDIGGFSQFGVGPWGPFAAVAYTEPEEPLAIEAPSELLRAVLLTEEEIDVAKAFGFSRVLARLGRAYRHYPFPPWIERMRASVASHDEMGVTILANMAGLHSKDATAVLLDDREVVLRLTPSAGEELRRALAGSPATSPLAMPTPIDRTANGCLVWEPGQRRREAITPEGSDGSRLSCCFILFAPDQPANGGRQIEDGVAFELTATSWAALRTTVNEGAPATIPPDRDGLEFPLGLSLEWVSDN